MGITKETIALFMLVAVLGGLAFQVPVGWLSDRFDRRLVLAGLGFGFAGIAVILVYVPRSLPVVLPPAALLGGFMSTLYPVCVSHAHDRMPADRVVAVSGSLILLSGLGSVFGPLVGSILMAHFKIDGVFYFMAAVAFSLAFLAAGRSLTTTAPYHLERPFEILAPQAARSRTIRSTSPTNPCRRTQSPLLPSAINSGLLRGLAFLTAFEGSSSWDIATNSASIEARCINAGSWPADAPLGVAENVSSGGQNRTGNQRASERTDEIDHQGRASPGNWGDHDCCGHGCLCEAV